MSTRIEQTDRENDLSNVLRSWIMIALTLMFVLLYASALIGWLRPLADEKMILRLEPIIFVIIGYYFGRLPSQPNEKTLKGEINRQTQRADAAQHAKEQAQRVGEALEEKVKNAKAILTSSTQGLTAKGFVAGLDKADAQLKEETLRQSVTATLSVLNS